MEEKPHCQVENMNELHRKDQDCDLKSGLEAMIKSIHHDSTSLQNIMNYSTILRRVYNMERLYVEWHVIKIHCSFKA